MAPACGRPPACRSAGGLTHRPPKVHTGRAVKRIGSDRSDATRRARAALESGYGTVARRRSGRTGRPRTATTSCHVVWGGRQGRRRAGGLGWHWPETAGPKHGSCRPSVVDGIPPRVNDCNVPVFVVYASRRRLAQPMNAESTSAPRNGRKDHVDHVNDCCGRLYVKLFHINITLKLEFSITCCIVSKIQPPLIAATGSADSDWPARIVALVRY